MKARDHFYPLDIKYKLLACKTQPHESTGAWLKIETKKAYGIVLDSDTSKVVWLPKSQVIIEEEHDIYNTVLIRIPVWLGDEKEELEHILELE